MVFWRELKWLVASYVLNFLIWLTKSEASTGMMVAFYDLAVNFKNDPSFETVPIRTVRHV